MQADPILEWQTLTDHYRKLGDDELRELAADFKDLTETAQQVLRAEMRSRGLGDPEKATSAPESPSVVSNAPEIRRDDSALPVFDSLPGRTALAFGSRHPGLVPDTPNSSDDDAGPHEYTWKTVLCECNTDEEAKQLKEVLHRAGIESWFNFGGYTTSIVPSISRSLQIGGIQVLVAADQLDQARIIAARPIPPEIVEESETEVPEFVPPSCPKCGASDPVLEAVDPANSWKCEQCGERWTESAAAGAEQPPKAG